MSLRPSSRFREIYRTGSRTNRGGLVVHQSPSPSASPEVGFVAGKRVGNAVARNRAKRRMREAARRVSFQPKRAYVVVASRGVIDVEFPQLVEWLSSAVAAGEPPPEGPPS